MAFIDYRLNTKYLLGFTGGPNWSTRRTPYMSSGRERRNKNWAMPKSKFTTNYALLDQQEREVMIHALMVTGGAFSSFRFRDPNDYRVKDAPLGLGDGTSDPIQLTKTYTFGPATFVRKITLPLNAVIKADGVAVSVTVDPLTGIATPDGPWPTGDLLTWSGKFDLRCHFSNDFNPLTAPASNVRECMVEVEEDPL